MSKGVFRLPNITNEPIKSYAPGSPERKELKSQINQSAFYRSRCSNDHRRARSSHGTTGRYSSAT